MIRTATAFKHPRCGGLIYMVDDDGRVFFQCDTCAAQAEEIETLAVGKPVILRRSGRKAYKRLPSSSD